MSTRSLTAAIWAGEQQQVRLMLENGTNVNARNLTDQMAPLEAAINRKDMEILRLLLEYGADVDALDERGTSALMSAVQSGMAEMVNLLLEKGAAVNHVNQAGMTALKLASWKQDWREEDYTDILRVLLDAGADVNLKGEKEDDSPALMYAVMSNDLPTVRLLVEAGAYVNADIGCGDAVWNLALREGYAEVASYLERAGAVEPPQARSDLLTAILWNKTDCIHSLLEQGADPNARDSAGNTALVNAVWWWSNLEIVRLLLKYGAQVNAMEEGALTELMSAAQKGASEIIRLLIAHGADINATDECGQTALMEAVTFGDAASVRVLLEAGADVNAAEHYDGYTSLIRAASNGNIETIHLLLQYGANIHVRTNNNNPEYYGGCTPLIAAAKHGNMEVAALLIEHGADVNEADDSGTTPLMWAASAQKIIRLLLENGADVNQRNIHERTALGDALEGDNTEVVSLLLRAGAEEGEGRFVYYAVEAEEPEEEAGTHDD